jgi:hypothetical protein
VAIFDLPLHEVAEIGQLVAGFASVIVAAGVFLVRKQVKLQAQDGRTELITGVTTLFVSVSRVFIEYPDMQKYFYARATPEDDDFDRAHAIAVTMADAMDHVVEHLSLMSSSSQRAWKAYISETYSTSPVLEELLQAHKCWWPKLQKQLGTN